MHYHPSILIALHEERQVRLQARAAEHNRQPFVTGARYGRPPLRLRTRWRVR